MREALEELIHPWFEKSCTAVQEHPNQYSLCTREAKPFLLRVFVIGEVLNVTFVSTVLRGVLAHGHRVFASYSIFIYGVNEMQNSVAGGNNAKKV